MALAWAPRSASCRAGHPALPRCDVLTTKGVRPAPPPPSPSSAAAWRPRRLGRRRGATPTSAGGGGGVARPALAHPRRGQGGRGRGHWPSTTATRGVARLHRRGAVVARAPRRRSIGCSRRRRRGGARATSPGSGATGGTADKAGSRPHRPRSDVHFCRRRAGRPPRCAVGCSAATRSRGPSPSRSAAPRCRARGRAHDAARHVPCGTDVARGGTVIRPGGPGKAR